MAIYPSNQQHSDLGVEVIYNQTAQKCQLIFDRKPSKKLAKIANDNGFKKLRGSDTVYQRPLNETSQPAANNFVKTMQDQKLICVGYGQGHNPESLSNLKSTTPDADQLGDTAKVSGRITQAQMDWLRDRIASDEAEGKKNTSTSYYLRQALALYIEQNS